MHCLCTALEMTVEPNICFSTLENQLVIVTTAMLVKKLINQQAGIPQKMEANVVQCLKEMPQLGPKVTFQSSFPYFPWIQAKGRDC